MRATKPQLARDVLTNHRAISHSKPKQTKFTFGTQLKTALYQANEYFFRNPDSSSSSETQWKIVGQGKVETGEKKKTGRRKVKGKWKTFLRPLFFPPVPTFPHPTICPWVPRMTQTQDGTCYPPTRKAAVVQHPCASVCPFITSTSVKNC